MNGPDFTHCGELIDWTSRAELDEHFAGAIDRALRERTFDIELARWAPDDPLAPQYEKWWTKQRAAVLVYAKTKAGDRVRVTVARRTDKGDGMVKCYLRANGTHVAAVA